MIDFFENEKAMISLLITAVTGVMTGPVFRMDPAAVGTLTTAVVAVFNLWVRFGVYSKKGATKMATVAATNAVAAVSGEVAGEIGQVTAAAKQTIDTAVAAAVGTNPPPGP